MSEWDPDLDRWIRDVVESAGSDAPVDRDLELATRPDVARRWPVAAAASLFVFLGGVGVVWAIRADRDAVVPQNPAPSTETVPIARPTTPATASETSAPATTLPPTSIAAEPALTRPIIDLDSCAPTWALDSGIGSVDGAYTFMNFDPFPLQVLTPRGGSIADRFAVAVRVFANQRFDGSGANATVNGAPARASFGAAGSGRERWGDLRWRLPDGSEGYLRTSTMTREEVLALAESLQPRAADSSIPGFDIIGDSYDLVDEDMSPFDVGPFTQSACAFEAGGWLIVTISRDEGIGAALLLTDRPFVPGMVAEQLDGQRMIIVTGRDDVALHSSEALASVRQATDEEWAELTSVDRTKFDPYSPLAPPTTPTT